jgi:hypothetical protein
MIVKNVPLVSDWVKNKSRKLESISSKMELDKIRAAYLSGISGELNGR